jgi:hypothetical protein
MELGLESKISGEAPSLSIAFVAGQFKRAAMVTHFGYQDEGMQLAGIDGVKRAIQNLDAFGADARSALVHLLDDADQLVRVLAARHLIKVLPERALAILKDIHLRGSTEARLTASAILQKYERGELKI